MSYIRYYASSSIPLPHSHIATFNSIQIAIDCVWSDPAREEQEPYLDDNGFGESLRGGGASCFGNKAVDHFLQTNQLSFIIRAHEAHSLGVALAKGAK